MFNKLRQSYLSKPLFVLIVLLLASLACYSDHPLWPNELTAAPPSPTPLPTPASDQPTRFQMSDIVVAPRPQQAASAFLIMPDDPRDRALTDKKQCDWNAPLEILYIGRQEDTGRIWYLVNCEGTVGWADEAILGGPISFLRGQYALTTDVGAENQGGTATFPIEPNNPPAQSPPPLKIRCGVNEVVSIVNFLVIKSQTPPTSEGETTEITDAVYYQIRCQAGVGWAEQERLFGPLLFPSSGGIGVTVPADVTLTSAAGVSADDAANVAGTCPASSFVETLAVERIASDIFYNIQCGETSGWTLQTNLYDIPIRVGALTMLFVEPPLIVEEEGTTEETSAEEPPAETTEGEPVEGEGDTTAQQDVVPSADLTQNPGFALSEEDVVGTCPSKSVVELLDVESVDGIIFYQVLCDTNGLTGWLPDSYLLKDGRVGVQLRFELDEPVLITEAGMLGSGTERLFYLNEEIKALAGVRGASTVGTCKVGTEATLLSVDFERQDLGSAGVKSTVLYQVSCQSLTDEEISGWVSQDRLEPVATSSE